MSSLGRKHRRTGNPRGGAREGAGKPLGSTNVLGQGERAAIKSLKFRVPEGTPEDIANVAGEAFERIVQIMRSGGVELAVALKAATYLRSEVCGAPTQRVEATGKDGGNLVIEVHKIVDVGDE